MKIFLLCVIIAFSIMTSCQESKSTIAQPNKVSEQALKVSFDKAMRAHLDAVEAKDINGMQQTMAPHGELFLMLDGRPLSKTSESFMSFHKEWFKDTTTTWSISFEIIETRVAQELGIAVVETTYQEPDRNGKPYYNKLHTSYTQQLIEGKWYVITDQSSSFEKSTDL